MNTSSTAHGPEWEGGGAMSSRTYCGFAFRSQANSYNHTVQIPTLIEKMNLLFLIINRTISSVDYNHIEAVCIASMA